MNYYKIYLELTSSRKVRGLSKKKLDFYTEKHHIIPRSLGGGNNHENLVLLTAREHLLTHRLLWKHDPSCVEYQRALWVMTEGGKIKGRDFEKLRLQMSKSLSGSGNPFYGRKHTEEAKRKTGEASRGRKQSLESRERMRLAKLGVKRSAQAIKNMSEAAKRRRSWQTSAVLSRPDSVEIWKMADKIFDAWLENEKPGNQRLETISAEYLDHPVSRGKFSTLVRLFREGWSPREDPEWVKFSEGV